MADVYAISNGFWSNPAIWSTGSLPLPDDIVYANNRIVYVDIDAKVNTVRTLTSVEGGPISNGGVFNLMHNISLTADAIAGTTTCLVFNSAFPNFTTVYGNISGSPRFSSQSGIRNTSSGTVIISGSVNGGITLFVVASMGARNESSGTIIVYGLAKGGAGQSTTANYALFNNSIGEVYLYGKAEGGYAPANGGSHGVYNNSTGNAYISGVVLGGIQGDRYHYGAYNNSGYLYISGDVMAGNGFQNFGLFNNTGTTYIYGNVYGGTGNQSYGCYNGGSGTIYISGFCIAGGGSSAAGAVNNLVGNITISEYAMGGNGSGAHGCENNSSGRIIVKKAIGNDWGLGSSGIVAGTVGARNVSIYGSVYVEMLESGKRGQFPTEGNIFINKQEYNNISFFSILSSLRDYSFSQISSDSNYSTVLSGITGYNFLFSTLSSIGDTFTPEPSNVRLNVLYDFSRLKGSINIPVPETVTFGVSTDNTFGTGINDPSLVWVSPLSSFENDTDTLGKRVINCITIENIGELIRRFK